MRMTVDLVSVVFNFDFVLPSGFSTVFLSLEAAAKALGRNLANETVSVVSHKWVSIPLLHNTLCLDHYIGVYEKWKI